MPKQTLEIIGADSVSVALLGLGSPAKVKTDIRKALEVGSQIIEAASFANAPRRTGRLKSGIRTGPIYKTRTGNWGMQVRPAGRDWFGIPPGSPWFYPAIVEHGTKHFIGRQYLRRAYQRHRFESAAAIEEKLKQLIERRAARATRAAQRAR